MSDCIFCKIVRGEIPSQKVFESNTVIGFKDLHPQAKTHLLFIHKNHTSNVVEMSKSDSSQFTDIYEAIANYTDSTNLSKKGFRIVVNTGPDAGQTVFHTHFHLLGDESLGRFGK